VPASRAEITTAGASRHLSRLAKHWAHRFRVERDDDHALVDFGDSRCELTADRDRLAVLVSTASADALPGLEAVVAEHLARVAPDEPLTIDWRRTP